MAGIKYVKVPADIPIVDPDTEAPINDGGVQKQAYDEAVAALPEAQAKKHKPWEQWVFRFHNFVMRQLNHDSFRESVETLEQASEIIRAFRKAQAGDVVQLAAADLAMLQVAVKQPRLTGQAAGVLVQLKPFREALLDARDTAEAFDPPAAPPPSDAPAKAPAPANGVAQAEQPATAAA